MSKDIKLAVEHIISDVCKDCKDKRGLCENGVCLDVITKIGCFFLCCAEQEKEKE